MIFSRILFSEWSSGPCPPAPPSVPDVPEFGRRILPRILARIFSSNFQGPENHPKHTVNHNQVSKILGRREGCEGPAFAPNKNSSKNSVRNSGENSGTQFGCCIRASKWGEVAGLESTPLWLGFVQIAKTHSRTYQRLQKPRALEPNVGGLFGPPIGSNLIGSQRSSGAAALPPIVGVLCSARACRSRKSIPPRACRRLRSGAGVGDNGFC